MDQIAHTTTLPIIQNILAQFDRARVHYCHWKSNKFIERSASGHNDLDLLVARESRDAFLSILHSNEFKEVVGPDASPEGIASFYGYDLCGEAFVHVHAHYQLILGHDATKNFHLPVEAAYIRRAGTALEFRVAEPAAELILLVIRLYLKHYTLESALIRHGRLSQTERQELEDLLRRTSDHTIGQALAEVFPFIDPKFFREGLTLLSEGHGFAQRAVYSLRLQRALRVHARHGIACDAILKLFRIATLVLRRRLFANKGNKVLTSGACMVALIGGDGSGKSTAAQALRDWLKKRFPVQVLHFGKPDWSWGTTGVRALLKMLRVSVVGLLPSGVQARFGQLREMLEAVCVARDRCRTYHKARKLCRQGRIVICDRYPMPGIVEMDGPRIRVPESGAPWLDRALHRLEQYYYRQILTPEIVIALRVPPEVAVLRKPDEDPGFVRARNEGIYRARWGSAPVFVVDTMNSQEEVLSHIKSIVWQRL